MSRPARFILSFDCEGKWGVADHLSARIHEQLSESRLREAYGRIVALLDEFDLPATFAFVCAFAADNPAWQRMRPGIEALAEEAPGYLKPALADLAEGSREGWRGDWAMDMVANARTGHELAFHGITHVPWGTVDQAFARAEIALAAELAPRLDCSGATYIFPRNQVAHVDVLGAAGIVGYRLAAAPRSRLLSLASEFDLFARSEADPPVARPLPIPAGYFINWLSGPRRLVPIAVSALRARRVIADAEVTGGVAHYWMHPENIASAPATFRLLRAIVEGVARARDAGHCEVLTQRDYCATRLRLPGSASPR